MRLLVPVSGCSCSFLGAHPRGTHYPQHELPLPPLQPLCPGPWRGFDPRQGGPRPGSPQTPSSPPVTFQLQTTLGWSLQPMVTPVGAAGVDGDRGRELGLSSRVWSLGTVPQQPGPPAGVWPSSQSLGPSALPSALSAAGGCAIPLLFATPQGGVLIYWLYMGTWPAGGRGSGVRVPCRPGCPAPGYRHPLRRPGLDRQGGAPWRGGPGGFSSSVGSGASGPPSCHPHG